MPDDEDGIFGLEVRRRVEPRAVEEAGGGISAGFELAEYDLVEKPRRAMSSPSRGSFGMPGPLTGGR
jgi:hypothetical protein